MQRGLVIILILFSHVICYLVQDALAFDDQLTHPDITDRAVKASRLQNYLKIDIGINEGIEKRLVYCTINRSIYDWLKFGAIKEDAPLCRASNHFHDPTKPWALSYVTDYPLLISTCNAMGWTPIDGALPRYSTITWATGYLLPVSAAFPEGQKSLLSEHPEVGRNNWDSAREHYYRALTYVAAEGRETAFAQTFQSLGQVLHLLEDMAVPAHVRNDFMPYLHFI